jgi:hypothetical protein
VSHGGRIQGANSEGKIRHPSSPRAPIFSRERRIPIRVRDIEFSELGNWALIGTLRSVASTLACFMLLQNHEGAHNFALHHFAGVFC